MERKEKKMNWKEKKRERSGWLLDRRGEEKKRDKMMRKERKLGTAQKGKKRQRKKEGWAGPERKKKKMGLDR